MVEAPADESIRMTPGRLLRAARERKGFSLQDTADGLNLQRGIIEALEAERYDILPPRTFVKGYLRAYAKLVDVKEHDVLAAFEQQQPEPAQESMQLTLPRGGERPQGAWLKWLVLLIALLLLGYGAYKVYAPEDRLDAPAAVSEEASLSPAPVATEMTLMDDDEVEVPPAADSSEPETIAPQPEEQPQVAEETAITLAEPEPEPEPAAATATLPAASASASASVLALEVSDESWIEISDATGASRHAGLVQGPRTLNITGQPPFRLTIGNAETVVVRYAGELVPLAPYTRRHVARLTLPLSP